MSLRQLEMSLVKEAREFLNAPKIRLKDLAEWRTSEITTKNADETIVKLPSGYWVSILTAAIPKAKA